MKRVVLPASALVLVVTACGAGAKPAPRLTQVGARLPSVRVIAAQRELAATLEARQLVREFALPPGAHSTHAPRNYGGVLRRTGHTEAAVDLARLAGLSPAGVVCEIVHDDGSMMRAPALRRFADEHGLLMISIADLVAYRRRTERTVERAAQTVVPTRHGEFRAVGGVP